jgi:pantoate kinase
MAHGLLGSVTVRLSHDLPIGQGFGTSAAGGLATALAVGALAGRSRAEAVQTAHLADLFGGGGLGGVSSILGGGLEVRLRPGIPPLGRIVHRPFRPALFVGVVGRPIPSPSVLGDRKALRRIERASTGWERLREDPTPARFFRLSERFTDRAGLSSLKVRRVVGALRRRGAWAGQAMFGESFFAWPRTPAARAECLDWLRSEGVHAVEVHAADVGARLGPVRGR